MEGRSWYGIIEHMLNTSAEHVMWAPGDSIVVAVSGGPDSVALLYAMEEISRLHTPLRLICAHVHHGFRPEESDAEADLVRDLAARLSLPFEMARVDVPRYMEESGKGPQEAARELRYRFLHEIAARYEARSIALAHHADDQAETVMLHLLRGSGPGGLSGMRFVRREKKVQLIRPLLRMYKTDLVRACEEKRFPYAIDSTNDQRKYRRNAVRLDVLPFLGQYNEQLVSSLNRMAEILSAEDEHMDAEAHKTYEELVHREEGRSVIKVPAFRELTVALQRRLIKLILNYLPSDSENVDFHKIEAVRRGLIQHHPTTWNLDLGGTTAAVREYDTASFFTREREHPSMASAGYHHEIHCSLDSGFIRFPEAKGAISWKKLTDLSEIRIPAGPDVALLDEEHLTFPLIVRTRTPGDMMQLMGLNGSKKVKDIFIDDKIPPSLRPFIPLVCDGSGAVLWIPGIRRSSHAAVQADTSSVIYMSWHTDGGTVTGD
ncbi:tRNA lysidine(34) synthetase TilS [Paenibacillus sp. P96]|uniref:tRNA(Ile)-lysidine synthase n=1 Tax=Paenibacillus zeirhizosphaerae TaxID=2987519 RepID=A0ABT9FWT8_9BACL|nr:tRNA lysidine(34) synthetase TilS [Paenibacillus sp. P96]MDP4099196.1 tRNA lysidine(34) synthetase TilS [Paenibacillus sp. P96]